MTSINPEINALFQKHWKRHHPLRWFNLSPEELDAGQVRTA